MEAINILTDGRGPLHQTKGSTFNETKMTPHMAAVLNRLSDDFGVRPIDVKDRSRGLFQISRVRQCFTWLLYERFNKTPVEVAAITGRSRQTTDRGTDLIDALLEANPVAEQYLHTVFAETARGPEAQRPRGPEAQRPRGPEAQNAEGLEAAEDLI